MLCLFYLIWKRRKKEGKMATSDELPGNQQLHQEVTGSDPERLQHINPGETYMLVYNTS